MFWRQSRKFFYNHSILIATVLCALKTFQYGVRGTDAVRAETFPSDYNCKCFRPQNSTFFLQEWRYSQRMILLGPCSFLMGSNSSIAIRGDKETPVRREKLDSQFWIDTHEVTKEQFSTFIHRTNYTTTAQEFQSSFVFSRNKRGEKPINSQGAWWWVEEKGVTWKSDLSPETAQHPVTHVSFLDAVAFCQHHGLQLPTEIQWEFACRGGLESCLYPWGNSLKPNGMHMANIWQGQFPTRNTAADGFELTSPVKSFPPNAYGLYDMAGNVWEWVEDSWDKSLSSNIRVQKGGSFMCHRNHCFRYRCAARTKGTCDSTSSNLGFRCVHNP